jgi:hypothetical protein
MTRGDPGIASYAEVVAEADEKMARGDPAIASYAEVVAEADEK